MLSGDTLTSVGRVGELTLDYIRNGHGTVLSNSRCRSPWHLLPPINLDDTGCAYTLLLNPSGGLVGGDHLSLQVTLGADAHVLLSTPSANRVYRSVEEPSVQTVSLAIGPGAVLEWMPEVTIPFAGSRFRQTIHVMLQPAATVLLWDAMASGRVARGERWAFASMENEIRIATASGEYLLDRYHLTSPGGPAGMGLANEWDYVGSLYVVNDMVTAKSWESLKNAIAAILEKCPASTLGGVSQPALPGLVVRLVARSAHDLNTTLEATWNAVRLHLWDSQVPNLRRY